MKGAIKANIRFLKTNLAKKAAERCAARAGEGGDGGEGEGEGDG
jgi:hypothetical protein